MDAINLSHIGKRYGDFALRDVNIALPQGCVLGLVGENGSGKSTLIRMIMGACRPDEGSVTVLGKPILEDERGLMDVRDQIGVVLDEACLPDEMTATQIGCMMGGIYTHWDKKRFGELVKDFGLPSGKPVREYSRGTKMKLAIACALSHHAKLLVLDEATGGLDPAVRDEILDLLNEFTREEDQAILLSSHIVSDLEKICDYIVFLHEGRVIMAEEKDALSEKYAVLALEERDADALDPSCVLRRMRTHKAVRVLAIRELLPRGMEAERASIEEIMLLLTKGEEGK